MPAALATSVELICPVFFLMEACLSYGRKTAGYIQDVILYVPAVRPFLIFVGLQDLRSCDKFSLMSADILL